MTGSAPFGMRESARSYFAHRDCGAFWSLEGSVLEARCPNDEARVTRYAHGGTPMCKADPASVCSCDEYDTGDRCPRRS